MRILIDKNLTPRWVEHLISAGHAARHWSSLGPGQRRMGKSANTPGLAYIVLTSDLDFPQILAHTGNEKPRKSSGVNLTYVPPRHARTAPPGIGPAEWLTR